MTRAPRRMRVFVFEALFAAVAAAACVAATWAGVGPTFWLIHSFPDCVRAFSVWLSRFVNALEKPFQRFRPELSSAPDKSPGVPSEAVIPTFPVLAFVVVSMRVICLTEDQSSSAGG